MKIRGLVSRGGLARGSAMLAAGLLALSLAAEPAFGAAAAPEAKVDDKATQDKATQEMHLRGIEDTMRASEEQRRRLEADIEAIRADRARLNAALIDTTAKVQDAERQIGAANARLTTLVGSENALRRSLESRRAVIADVLAVLQRMGRSPPPAILVRPRDMSEAIRAAMLLGAVLPDLKSETAARAQDLDELAALRKSIAGETENLASRAEGLAKDKERLTALVAARQNSLTEAEH